MANVLVQESSLTAIGNAIRGKNGESTTYKPAEMGPAISAISTGTDTSDATAAAGQIYKGATAYVNGEKVIGTAEAYVSGTTLYIPEGLMTV